MFTDIVGSVELQQRLGTEAYTRFVTRHDAIFKECLASNAGAEILNETGDGFLVLFSDPSDAVNAALRLQSRLAGERFEGESIRLRIGLNMGMVTETSQSVLGERRAVGMSINLAARVMALGDAGQILMTRAVYDEARQFVREHPDRDLAGPDGPALQWVRHGVYELKGRDEPVEVFEVGVAGVAPLRAPAGDFSTERISRSTSAAASPAGQLEEVPLEVVKASDVYISYAPVDNRPLSPGQEGWISQFHRNLETRIEQLSGEALKVVQRPPIDEALASQQLLEAVPGAKAMVSIFSPPFVKSSNCVREAEAFWRKAREAGNLRLENRTRLLKVVKTPVALADVPEALGEVFSDLLSFDFFMKDPETGRLWEFDETFGVEARRRYYERVYDLAYELCHILRAFQRGAGATRQALEGGRTVFLAETTSELQGARDRLKRELMERGHVVLPDRPLPLSAPQLEVLVKEYLDRSDVAVHLVGSVYGLVPEQAERSMVELQNGIAAQCVSEGAQTTRLIWLPRDRSDPEPRQAQFIRQLMEDQAAQLGADVIEDTLEEFKAILVEALEPQSVPTPASQPDRVAPLVYLICDPADEAAVEPLEDYLFDQGFEVATPSFEGSESEIAALHRQNLVHCDAVLIYYGAGSKGWVETKLMDLQQAPGYGRQRPIRAKIVYIAPPWDRRKERFRSHQAQVVRPGDDRWDPQLLSPFVEQLKTLTAGA
jgi:class 3 adenylate cyclase